jgi:hypothetical protein
MQRREFITLLGVGAAAWPLAARAQQQALPVVAFIRDGSADAAARFAAAFRKGLNESGYVEGQNVTVGHHWLEGQYDRLPALMADLVRQQVAGVDGPRARCLMSIVDQSTRVAARVILAFSNLETGHPVLALAASSANFA